MRKQKQSNHKQSYQRQLKMHKQKDSRNSISKSKKLSQRIQLNQHFLGQRNLFVIIDQLFHGVRLHESIFKQNQCIFVDWKFKSLRWILIVP